MSVAAAVVIPPGAGGGPPFPPSDLVLDASVAIKWYIPEPLAADARRFMSPGFRMHVPAFFAAECGNTIWKKVAQRRELDRDRGREILGELAAYPMQVHETGALVILAYDLAHGVGDPKLAVYDFVYLALAVALDVRLVTADRVFHDAIRPTMLGHRLLWVADPI
jgi:predicted nucleic acid-binding protein